MEKFYNDSEFVKTNKKVTFTFGGWDGKSYDGETRNQSVYEHKMFPGKVFVRSSLKGDRVYHMVDFENLHKKSNAPTCFVVAFFQKDGVAYRYANIFPIDMVGYSRIF